MTGILQQNTSAQGDLELLDVTLGPGPNVALGGVGSLLVDLVVELVELGGARDEVDLLWLDDLAAPDDLVAGSDDEERRYTNLRGEVACK